VPQMCAIYRYAFSVTQHADVLPVRFLVSKGWPAVGLAFDQKVVHGTTNGRGKQDFSRVGVTKFDLRRGLGLGKKFRFPFVVSAVFGVVSVVVANIALRQRKVRIRNSIKMCDISSVQTACLQLVFRVTPIVCVEFTYCCLLVTIPTQILLHRPKRYKDHRHNETR
jgi:hypothetical protein